MKKRSPTPAGGTSKRDRDTERLRALLKVRERQVRVAVRTLKEIVSFRSVTVSVFATEVETVQRRALVGLCEMDEAEKGHPGRVLRTALVDNKALQRVLSRLTPILPRVRLEDEDV